MIKSYLRTLQSISIYLKRFDFKTVSDLKLCTHSVSVKFDTIRTAQLNLEIRSQILVSSNLYICVFIYICAVYMHLTVIEIK